MIEQGGVDVLISDLNMPVLDGLELVRAMNDGRMAEPPKMIMVTSAVGDALLALMTSLGVGAVVQKPLTLEKLTTACKDIKIRPAAPPAASG
jgi:CheY-like chemotaxis protein